MILKGAYHTKPNALYLIRENKQNYPRQGSKLACIFGNVHLEIKFHSWNDENKLKF